MLVRILTNIGTRDCDIMPPLMEGDERDVSDPVAKSLIARGLAVDITPPKPKPPVKKEDEGTVEKATADLEAYRVRAIPAEPVIAESKPPEVAPTPAEPEPPKAKEPPLKVKAKHKGP